MGSRLKENPERTFYWCFEASCPIARDKDPGVLFQFPEDFCDEESLQTLPRFCFPYDIERVKDTVAVQHFTFVLTDLEGCQRFGFCRLTSSSQTCLCILSYLPWFEVFYKLLNNLADYLTKGQTNEMRELLATLYKHPVPLADGLVYLQLGEQLQLRTGVPQPRGHMPLPNGEGAEGVPYFIAPDPRSLPSIPESRNLTELVVAVDVGNLLQLYASMLFERRILIYCSKLSTLTACVHACSGMLFPMYWQHIFIPVLPPHLLDYCCAPMPYLIGVHSSQTEKVRSRALEDVVIFNVDTNTMESPFEDLKKIPSDVVAALKVRLKKQSTSAGSGVARAFLRAQAVLFGGYRDALQYPPGGSIFFSEESFLDHKSHSMKQFLESAIHLQSFKQFIDGRLEQLNKGREPADIFEEEILQCGASAGGTRSYQQWVGNLKKGGGALLLKSKAHLYRAAKSHNKFGLRNFLSAKEDELHSLQRGGSISDTHTYRRVQSDCLQSRLPITQHFGRSRPRRPARGFASQQEDELQQESSNWRPAWEDGAVDCLEQVSGEAEDLEPSLMPDPEEMDLLGEIFDTLSAQTSMEHGLLYGTRSLDLFGPDSTDFITRREMAAPSQESLNISTGPSGSLRSWEEGLEEQGEGPGGLQEGPDESGEGPSGVGDGLEDEARRMEEEAGNLKEGLKEELGYHWSRQDRQVYGMGAGLDEQVEKRVQSDGLGAELNDQDGLKEMEEEEEKGRGGPSGPRTRDDKEQEDGVEEKRNVRVNEELQREKKSCSVPDPGPSPVAPTQRGALRPGADRERDAPKTTPTGTAQASSSRSTTSQEEREEEKESSAPPSHRVMSAVALFQVRASHDRKAQPRVSPEAGKPSSSCRGGDWALKNTPQGPGTQASSNGPSVGTQPGEPAANSPVVVTPAVTSATAPDSLNKEEDLPLPKVSEMKKRFEL